MRVISLILFLSASSWAWAGEYFFVTLEYPPVEYAGADGKVEGVATDIVTHIMNQLGHTVHIKVYPWTRALDMVEEGKADAIFTAFKTPERESRLDFCSQILLPQVVYFYKRKGSCITFDGNLEALQGKRIGVVSTISYGNKFDNFKSLLHVEQTSRFEHGLQKLLLGRIDLVVSNGYTGEYTIHELGLDGQIVRVKQEIENVPSYVAFSRKRNLVNLRNEFDSALAKFKESDEYLNIVGRLGIYLRN